MLDEGILGHHAVDVSACDVTANLTAGKREVDIDLPDNLNTSS